MLRGTRTQSDIEYLAVRGWVQYTHLDKLYGYLPGMPDAEAAVFGLSAAAYAALRADLRRETEDATDALLAEAGVVEAVRGLPFEPGHRVLIAGDSITDDLMSWADMLQVALDRVRPGDEIEVANAGLSAHTTAMILRRWPATLNPRPDWILCALGGNDVTRIGPDPAKTVVSRVESFANLAELRRIAAMLTEARWLWLTPVPVDERRVADFQPFRRGQSSWRNDDIRALAAGMHDRFDDPIVDLVEAFGVPPRPDLQGADGVHPLVAGQQEILRAVLRRLDPQHRR